jgi:uncharacterized protein (DUF2384 family)
MHPAGSSGDPWAAGLADHLWKTEELLRLNGWQLRSRLQMLAAPNDDAFSKFVEGRLWSRKRVVIPRRKFSQERSFRFITFGRIWIKSLSKPVVKGSVNEIVMFS